MLPNAQVAAAAANSHPIIDRGLGFIYFLLRRQTVQYARVCYSDFSACFTGWRSVPSLWYKGLRTIVFGLGDLRWKVLQHLTP